MPKAPRQRSNGSSIEVASIIGGGAAKLKKKIRDIQRLLKKDNLPGDVRTENERALKGLQVELQNTQLNLKAKEIAKKYHMVRFFERKKAIRKLKGARKQLEDAEKTEVKKDIKKARKVVKHSEIDLAYVVLFPKTEKYISLYPNSEKDGEDTNPKAKKGLLMTDERRLQFKKEVENLIDENKLPFSIEDALKGRSIQVDHYHSSHQDQQEIDAAVEEDGGVEEDDFFE
ncbi:uncharacterized protein CANTADRAFT_7075 [Suhomyces tanzawaensis NRRL Y-17324]|uniref:rRNA-processing protein EFG1 n=1 Tax=Suhomyces tanzawaensis NRRL Y-17324 TaxID=984487 RepID=A0A1E4SGT4_9ASCO|nr:uncharacterized protein CANTADRAFT_7075 [Suhomyces tanzawaensis NRRL Y-17324]ODV78727.1 hypothetical protein CANTADRAFT_7075 [Suhomyces tanzawaensis NRRL Y-17324]